MLCDTEKRGREKEGEKEVMLFSKSVAIIMSTSMQYNYAVELDVIPALSYRLTMHRK